MVEINESELDNGTKHIGLLTYIGDGDPVHHLDIAVKDFVKSRKYSEFVDINMDNPWMRVVIVERTIPEIRDDRINKVL